jgi:predicted ATPase
VVDDLHLADDASLAVLHLIVHRSRSQQVMVLLIARTGELSSSPQAAKLREAAVALGIRQIELHPLSDDDCEELLVSLSRWRIRATPRSPHQLDVCFYVLPLDIP